MGAQGYSLSKNSLRNTDEYRDLMGYCRPRWVSDWTWNGIATKMREMSSPDAFAYHLEQGKRSLSGYVEDNGITRWAAVPGALTEPGVRLSASRYAKLMLPVGSRNVPVSVLPSSEPGLVEVVATLPEGPLPTRIEVVVDGSKHLIDVAQIPQY